MHKKYWGMFPLFISFICFMESDHALQCHLRFVNRNQLTDLQHDTQFWPPHCPLNTPQTQSLNDWWEQLSCLINSKYKMLSNLIFRCPNCREWSILLREWWNSYGLCSDWTISQEVHQLSPPPKYFSMLFFGHGTKPLFSFQGSIHVYWRHKDNKPT